MAYRPEIDGLRAIAVLSVIFFHAGFSTFSGGFVGVDVFFVISGFLITKIIVADLTDSKFSLISFYERRARRILPALFLVCLVTIPAAWLWLMPLNFRDYAQSMVAVATFSSNVQFWRESGYFGTAAELKPLLHTWSLAVEEQFYILFPPILFISWRLGRRYVVAVILLLLLSSLVIAEMSSQSDPSSAFFLLPSRGWEVMIGALIAFVPVRSMVGAQSRVRWLVNTFASFAGLAAILFGIFVFDETTPVPGFQFLIPTIGTAVIIVFGRDNNLVSRFLGNRILAGVGLISYSAYLWHYPLFVFSRHRTDHNVGQVEIFSLIIMTMVLGYLSWKYVEQPFRNRKKFNRRVIFTGAGLGVVFFIAVGLTGHIKDGFESRYSGSDAMVLAAKKTNSEFSRNSAYDRFGCFFDNSQNPQSLIERECLAQSDLQKFILFGDSEAAHFYPGFVSVIDESKITVMQFTGTGCRAVTFSGQSDRCRRFNELFVETLPTIVNSGDIVFLSSDWDSVFEVVGRGGLEESLRSTMESVYQAGAEIVLIGNSPEFNSDPYYSMVRRGQSGSDSLDLPIDPQKDSDAIVREFAAENSLLFFEPKDVFCRVDSCTFKQDGEYLFFDASHLSHAGSKLASERLFAELNFH